MDYLRCAIALGPLGLYWVMIGYLYQRPSPMLLNAAQDTLLFGLGGVGLVLIGPMELFFPNAAYSVLGSWTWFFLLCLYGFVVLLVSLNRRPQWTLYGASAAAARGILARTLEDENIEHAWHDFILVVPELGIQAIVEPANPTDRAAHLSRCGRVQDILGWHRLEKLITKRLPNEPSTRGGVPWILVGLAMLVATGFLVWMDLDRVIAEWQRL